MIRDFHAEFLQLHRDFRAALDTSGLIWAALRDNDTQWPQTLMRLHDAHRVLIEIVDRIDRLVDEARTHPQRSEIAKGLYDDRETGYVSGVLPDGRASTLLFSLGAAVDGADGSCGAVETYIRAQREYIRTATDPKQSFVHCGRIF